MLAVAGVVVIANLLYVVGVFDANPLGPRSGLVSAVTPGPAPGVPTLDLNDGFISQAVSHRAMLDWLHLQVPWWNPYEATGTPLAGEMAGAAFFPPTLFTLLSGGQLYERMLLELLAGLSTFLLLRRLSVNRTVAVAGAVAFELNGTFAWFAHAPVNPIAFLPLLLLGVELSYAATLERRRGGWWLVAVAGALSVYAGFPETAYIDTLLALGWVLWRGGCLGPHRLRPFVAKLAAGAIAGTLLAAPLLLAFVNYANHGDLGVHGGVVGGVAIPPRGLSMLVMPYVFGPIFAYNDPAGVLSTLWKEVGGYLSTSLLLFALLGLWSRRRRGLKLILLGWIVLSVARIYDEPHLVSQVIGVLPGMSRVAFYRYAFPALELAVIILAALGLDDLASRPWSRARVVFAAAFALALVLLAIFGATALDHQLGSGHSLYSRASAIWAASILAIGAAATLVRSVGRRTLLTALVVTVDALALFVVPQLSVPTTKLNLTPVAYLQRHLGLQRFFTMGPIRPNYGTYFGLGELDATDLPLPSSFTSYVHNRLDPYTDPLVFVGNNYSGRPPTAPSTQSELLTNLANFRDAGVAYVLTPPGQTLPMRSTGFQLVFRSPSTWIYHLHGAAPYFSASNPQCAIRPNGRQSVQLSCPSPTLLLRRETDFAGWSAQIDGHPRDVRRADGLFQVVNVPTGLHHVTFSYAPPGENWGLLAFLAGCGWLIGAAMLRRRAGPRGQASAS